ncbi:MAG: carboxypeptidase regulatory-like domain-containing protein [Blastocatellia bacterium]|nr:carboxypeptidase regulatory-like domain-containing protein [Blastocatellia bacterium]
MILRFAIALIITAFASMPCLGQGIMTPRRHQADAQKDTAQPDPEHAGLPAALPVSAIKIKLQIDGQVATVRVEHLFRNDTDELLEGTYFFPVPEGATLLEFAVYDGEERRLGRVKEKEEARAQYAAAAAQGEDPAILEMTRKGWFRSHVYPIPPHSDKRVEIVYSQILPVKEGTISFDYPLGKGYKKLRVPVSKVEIDMDLHSQVAIKNVFSPSHPAEINYDGDRHVTGRVLPTVGGGDAENFQLLYSLSDEEFGMSLLTHRKEGEDGYFLLMLSPKVEFDKNRISGKDVVFVLDVSGSMQGDKLQQAKEALRFGLTRTLSENDRFSIIAFSNNIQPMGLGLIAATKDNIARALNLVNGLNADGGTNINDSLVAAMNLFERSGRPQNLVFITDGMPTVSATNPEQIAANVRSANTSRARLFTFGVGSNVNMYLLEKLSTENRGAQSNITDQSELRSEVSTFFAKVSQPVLADMFVDFGPLQVDRVHPAQLPDLYTRSQIKIFGRYRNLEDIKNAIITLTGMMSEQPQRFEFDGLNFPLVTTDKEFLPKLWATERVEALLAEIRLNGETPALKQEVIELAREFNLVTPYTSMYVPTAAELEREKEEAALQSQTATKTKTMQFGKPGTGSGGGMGAGDGKGAGSNAQSQSAITAGQVANLPLNNRTLAPLSLSPRPAPGAVVDPQGAAIAGATVTIRDEDTGATRTVITDTSGNYSVAGLPPGNYSVKVEAEGFKKTEIQNVTVQPGQTAAAGVTLDVGATAETVTVTSVAPAFNTSSAHTSSSYDSTKLRDLPSLVPVDSFARLVPGINTREPDEATGLSLFLDPHAEFIFRINGGRARSNYFTIDGRDNNDIDGRPAVSLNNFDAVLSLHVVTTRGPGDLSLAGASSINLTTRPGTNNFHGTIFGYHLNRRLGTLSALERRSGLDRPPLFKNNIYGGTFGGPIIRDRMFFFGAFQGEAETSHRFIDSTSSFLTPTETGLAALARIFGDSPTISDLIARGPLAQTIGDPRILRTFTIPVMGVPVEFGQVSRLMPSITRGYEAGGRFDFYATPRDTLKAVYWYDRRRSTNSIGRLAAGYPGDSYGRAQFGNLRWNRAISPKTSNEIGFGFNRARLSLDLCGGAKEVGTPTAIPCEGASLIPCSPAPLLPCSPASISPRPAVTIGPRSLAYGFSPMLGDSHLSTLFEASDALVHIAGRHNIRLGGQFRRRITSFDHLPGAAGNYTYASFEDFALDRPTTLAVAVGDPQFRFTETDQHYYIDDAWRVRPELTLSFGLSYENASQPINGLVDRVREREADPSRALFDPLLPLEMRTLPRVKRDNNNFAPRFGFAYTPRFRVLDRYLFGYDETVIRGGVSLSYDSAAYRPLAEIARSAPNVLLGVITPDFGSPTVREGFPAFPNVPGAAELGSLLGGDPRNYGRAELAHDFRAPYSINWHLMGSRNFYNKVEFEVGYAGARGIGLIRATDANPFIPGSPSAGESVATGSHRIYESAGRSTYNSLQTKLDVRIIDTLVGGVSYTLSRLTDDVPSASAQLAGGPGNPISLAAPQMQAFAQNPSDVSSGERALSSLDRRHFATGHFVWTLPLGRGETGVRGRLLTGWQASGIVEVASGSPYTPLQFAGYSPSASSIFASIFSDRSGAVRPFEGNAQAPADRVAFSNAANAFFRFFTGPDGTPIVSPTGFIIADRSGFRPGSLTEARFIYNDFAVEQAALRMGLAPDAFGETFAAGRPFGDVKRNSLTGPRLFNVDFALLKTTKLTEKVLLQFRAEFFNLFNHPSRTVPNFTVENAGGFGFADIGETNAAPRRVRLALKLIF